ncbi:MAG TPA: chromate transporter [Beijerinckiaceae bacterium]|jgi:chromate transporter
MDNRLVALFAVFAPLSLLSFGGGQAIVADIQHQTVDVYGFLSNQEFADLFAISRAAPGPSTLIAALIGYHVAGFAGAIAGCLAIYVPSSALVYGAANWWQRRGASPLKRAVERGLAPIAVGLIFAGALSVLRASHAGILELLTAAVTALILFRTRFSSYFLVLIVALVFLAIYAAGLSGLGAFGADLLR